MGKKRTNPPTLGNFTLPGAPVTAPSATSSLPLPHRIIVDYHLPQGSSALTYTTSSGARRPETGKELYDSIFESKLPSAAKSALVDQFFGAGFDPGAMKSSRRDAYFNAITYDPTFLSGNLGGMLAPSGAALAVGATRSAKANAPKDLLVQSQFAELYAGQSKTIRRLNLELTNPSVYAQQSAYGIISNYLDTWGLQEDSPYVYKMILHHDAHLINTDQILNAIRGNAPSGLGTGVDATLRKNYETVFPGLTQYNTKPGAFHMTETQYQSYTQAVQDAASQFGQVRLNQGQVSQLLNGNVSPSEFSKRVQDIGVAVQNADAGTKAILQKQYGINPEHLFAYYANPKEALPDMQRAIASGELQDYAKRVGFAGLTAAQGNQLGDMAKLSATQGNNPLGYGVSNIETSLLGATRDMALLHSAPGANAPTINTNQLIGSQLAGFGGTTQASAQLAVGRAEQARTAPFEKGGGFEEDNSGVVGVGSART